jgi:hypothetical protein
MAPSIRSQWDLDGDARFLQKSALAKLGAYMRGEGCRKHLSYFRFAAVAVKIFGLTRGLPASMFFVV